MQSLYEVNIGLVLQYHFVALLKSETPSVSCNIDDSSQHNANNLSNVSDNSNNDGLLNDEEIQQHTASITGGPSASMLALENPEAIVSIAPCEGNRPLPIHTDTNFELMCNPNKFCFGNGGYNSPRERKITYRKYFNQRLLDIDGRFAKDFNYLFLAQFIVESKQVFDEANNFIWRQKPSRQFTASQARNPDVIFQFVQKHTVF